MKDTEEASFETLEEVEETPRQSRKRKRNPDADVNELTEIWNSERFAEIARGKLLHVLESGWSKYDGTRWGDSNLAEESMGMQLLVRLFAESDLANNPKEARKILSAKVVRASVSLSRASLAARITDFDRDEWALNTLNGTVDLRTGELRAHSPDDRITKLCPVEYDVDAKAPLWESTLERALPDPEVRSFVQRLLGYAIIGSVYEHILAFFYGTGANSKSTVLNAAQEALGDYARTIPSNVLMTKQSEAHPTEIAQLRGLRLAVANESRAGQTIDEGLVKSLTGGDPITARFMRQDFFQFQPSHTLILCSNHKPRIRGQDEGVWRRVMLIPWEVTIPKAERDPGLPAKLRAQRAGILAWLVQGARAYQERGLDPPAAVLAATREFRTESDVIGRFLEECCVLHVPSARTRAGEVYATYTRWCESSGERAMSGTAFGTAIKEAGIDSTRGAMGVRYHLGLRDPSAECRGVHGFPVDSSIRDPNSDEPYTPNTSDVGEA